MLVKHGGGAGRRLGSSYKVQSNNIVKYHSLHQYQIWTCSLVVSQSFFFLSSLRFEKLFDFGGQIIVKFDEAYARRSLSSTQAAFPDGPVSLSLESRAVVVGWWVEVVQFRKEHFTQCQDIVLLKRHNHVFSMSGMRSIVAYQKSGSSRQQVTYLMELRLKRSSIYRQHITTVRFDQSVIHFVWKSYAQSLRCQLWSLLWHCSHSCVSNLRFACNQNVERVAMSSIVVTHLVVLRDEVRKLQRLYSTSRKSIVGKRSPRKKMWSECNVIKIDILWYVEEFLFFPSGNSGEENVEGGGANARSPSPRPPGYTRVGYNHPYRVYPCRVYIYT